MNKAMQRLADVMSCYISCYICPASTEGRGRLIIELQEITTRPGMGMGFGYLDIQLIFVICQLIDICLYL